MQFTKEQLDQLIELTCPHCRAGIRVRKRDDTGEWVHDQIMTRDGAKDGHTICWANGIRREAEKN